MQGLSSPQCKDRLITIVLGGLIAIFIGALSGVFGLLPPLAFIGLCFFVLILLLFITYPRSILVTLILYCFLFGLLGREIGGNFPYGVLIEGILVLGWVVILFKIPKQEWNVLQNDLCFLILIWFLISVLEIINPAGASVQGWLQEIRSTALYPFLIVPAAFLLFNKNKHLNLFIILILSLALIGALNGIKQLHIGLWPGEQRFLDSPQGIRHMIWGKLRVFSFYDAGQFGAFQAAFAVMAIVLALGIRKSWKRHVLFIAAGLYFYGMLISGTRGALFAMVVAAFVAIILSKNFKILFIGSFLMVFFLGMLKFTNVGSGFYEIHRLRSALNPEDASLNVRLTSQKILRDYLSHHPFGGGLGVIGTWGHEYNSDKFLSTIEPDSYWVKVWAMYGIVGFTIWLGIMMYILGKCCGIVWKIRDPGLRTKMIALTSGFAGILFCSYGNEVINSNPSSIVVYISWVFIFISPKLEKEIMLKEDSLVSTI